MGKHQQSTSTQNKGQCADYRKQLSEMIRRNEMDMARQWEQKASSSMTVNRPKSTTATFPMPPPGFFPNPDVSIGNALSNIPLPPPPPPPPSSSQQSRMVAMMGSQMGANHRPPSREQSASSWMTASRPNATATTTPIPMPPPSSSSHPSQMVPMMGSQMGTNHRQPPPKLLVPPMPENLPMVAVNAYKEYGYFMYRANKALQVLQALGEHKRAPERTPEPEAAPEQQTGPSTSSSSSWNPHSISSQGQYRWVKKEEQPAQRQGHNAEPLVDLADDAPQRFVDPVEPSTSANRPVEMLDIAVNPVQPPTSPQLPRQRRSSSAIRYDDYETMLSSSDAAIKGELLKIVDKYRMTQEQLAILTKTSNSTTLTVLTTNNFRITGERKEKFIGFLMSVKKEPRNLLDKIEMKRRTSDNLVFLPPFTGPPELYPFSPEQVARLEEIARRLNSIDRWNTYKAVREVNGVPRANGPQFRADNGAVLHWLRNRLRENRRQNAQP